MPKGFADKLKSCVGHRSKFGRRCLDGRRKKWIQTVLGTVTCTVTYLAIAIPPQESPTDASSDAAYLSTIESKREKMSLLLGNNS